MATDTLILRVPSKEVPQALRTDVEEVLRELAPLVAARMQEKRQTDFQALIDVLMRGVKPRSLDINRAQKQAKALQAILENSEWLTAEDIGERGKFSQSNLAAPANRWKQEGKIFALPYGPDRFARYALDEAFRPLPGLESVLKALGPISAWRIAAWFESTNAWLNNERPREHVASDPLSVLRAAQHYRDIAHG